MSRRGLKVSPNVILFMFSRRKRKMLFEINLTSSLTLNEHKEHEKSKAEGVSTENLHDLPVLLFPLFFLLYNEINAFNFPFTTLSPRDFSVLHLIFV